MQHALIGSPVMEWAPNTPMTNASNGVETIVYHCFPHPLKILLSFTLILGHNLLFSL